MFSGKPKCVHSNPKAGLPFFVPKIPKGTPQQKYSQLPKVKNKAIAIQNISWIICSFDTAKSRPLTWA